MKEAIINELNIEEKEAIRHFLIAIYGENQTKGWRINTRVAAIVEQMITKLDNCSQAMDIVPRPHGITKAGMKYVMKQIKNIATRSSKRNTFQIDKHYKICMRVIKLNFKSHLSMASMGF